MDSESLKKEGLLSFESQDEPETKKKEERYWKIAEKIKCLNASNIRPHTEEIQKILNEGETLCPSEEPLIYKLVDKTLELFKEEDFATLVKQLYQRSDLRSKEDLPEKIFKKVYPFYLASRCIAQLKIFLPLDERMSTRLLWKFTTAKKLKKPLLEVLTFLIEEGANAFEMIDDKTPFTSFVENCMVTLWGTKKDEIVEFLQKVLKKLEISNASDNFLNVFIKSIPMSHDKIDRISLFQIWESIFEMCSTVIDHNCDAVGNVDDMGKTPIRNLLQRLNVNKAWKVPEPFTDDNYFLTNLITMMVTYHRDHREDNPITRTPEMQIQDLTERNIEDEYRKIIDILEEGIEYPEKQDPVICSLLDKTDELFKNPSFGNLVKRIYDNWKDSEPPPEAKIYLSTKIDELVENLRQDTSSHEQKFSDNLKIFLPLEDGLSTRHRRLEKMIQDLTEDNIEDESKKIIEILEEGPIECTEKQDPVICSLLDKSNALYKNLSFSNLVKRIYDNWKKYQPSQEAKIYLSIITDVLVENLRKNTRSKAHKYSDKLKIFLPLEDGLSTSLLWEFIRKHEVWNSYFLDVLIFLLKEGADPFDSKDGKTPFTHFIENFVSRVSPPALPEVVEFVKESSKRIEHYSKRDSGVNDVIKALPSIVIEGDFKGISSVRESIVNMCFKMIELNGSLCDNVDAEGRTPIHNLLRKLVIDNLFTLKPKFVDKPVKLWTLISELITENNVNIKDKEDLTSYVWIILWQESAKYMSTSENEDLIKRIEEIDKHFQSKEVKKDDTKVQISREKQLLGTVRRLMEFDDYRSYKLRMGTDVQTNTDELIAYLKEKRANVFKTIDCLAGKVDKECFKKLPQEKFFRVFVEKHIRVQNEKYLKHSNEILKFVMENCDAQQIFDCFADEAREAEKERIKGTWHRNYHTLFGCFKQCLEKGAHPSADDIIVISRLILIECKTSNSLLTTLEMINGLIDSYRQHEKQDSMKTIKIHLNPIQDQYTVSESMRRAAGKIIEKAYFTLSNSMNSGSVINCLAFLGLGKGENVEATITKCFEKADELLRVETKPLQKETNLLLTEKQNGADHEQDVLKSLELIGDVMKRNDNWLQRNLLHLAAIFSHDYEVLKCIPAELIKNLIHERDLHGSTPLHIAYLHNNIEAIDFFKSHGAIECPDYFGKLPASLKRSTVISLEEDFSMIMNKKQGVFEWMKKLVTMEVQECDAIERDFLNLFGLMASKDNAEIRIGGSVREKLKVCQFDEVDVQIITTRQLIHNADFECLRLNERLVQMMNNIEWKGISLRPVSVIGPWKFLWEKEGVYHCQEISVDVANITIVGSETEKLPNQDSIIHAAPGHKKQEILKLIKYQSKPLWRNDICKHEWDILDNIPPKCRLGILIAKTLLEALYQSNGTKRKDFFTRTVTSYSVKNALMLIIKQDEELYTEVILNGKLTFDENKEVKWLNDEDLIPRADGGIVNEGRKWAEEIFNVLLRLAWQFSELPRSILIDEYRYLNPIEVFDVIDTCQRCLERLQPEVFFD